MSRPISTPSSSTAGPARPTRRRRRWKVRTRVYADSGECWLEVKTRGARGITVKERLPHGGPIATRCRTPPATGSRERLAEAHVDGVDPPRPGADAAHQLSAYDAAARRAVPGGPRSTATCLGVRGTARAAVGDVLVVETKSGSVGPGPLDRRLWELGHRPIRISKYGTGLALLTPDLPAQPLAPGHLAAPRRPPHPREGVFA